MSCVFLDSENNCKVLNEKQICNCSFYKKNTEDNYNKFIIQVEKDIQIYPKILRRK